MDKTRYKKLIKTYNKKLNKLNKIGINDFSVCFEYFITYLRFMRDKIIIETDQDKLDTDYTVQTICSAINEYNISKDLINKYYIVSKNNICLKDTSIPAEVQEKAYQEEKKMHLINFWSLVSANITLWENYCGNTI